MKPIVYGSCCSGHCAVTQALGGRGWEPAFFSEIEAFPSAVLAHRLGGGKPEVYFDPSDLPAEEKKTWENNNAELDRMAARGVFGNGEVPNLGDFTKIDPARWKGKLDCLWAGTPCQDWSIAGLRAGLSGHRGGITMNYIQLAADIDVPWAVWENVPGVLSQNGGKDFDDILLAWEERGFIYDVDILDSQHFGLPQRRRRVFLVCHSIEHGLKTKTDFLAQAALTSAATFLLSSLVGHVAPSQIAGAGWTRLGVLSADGLKRRMQQFSLWPNSSAPKADSLLRYRALLEASEDALRKSRPEQQPSTSASKSSTPPAGTAGGKSPAGKAKANRSMSTSPSWSAIWDALCERANTSTTSTPTKTTTTSEIFTCAEMLLSIGEYITSSTNLPPSYSAAASSVSTALKVFTNYARRTNSDLFGILDSPGDWGAFASSAEGVQRALERRIGDWADLAGVFPEPEGLRRSAPESDSPEKDIAGTVTSSLGSRSAEGAERGTLVAGTIDAAAGRSRGAGINPGAVIPILEPGARTGPASATEKAGDGFGEQGDPMFTLQTRRVHGVAVPPPLAFGGNNTRGPIDVATARLAHPSPHGHMDFESETFIAEPMPFDTTQITHPENRSNPKPGGPAPTLAKAGHPPAIAFNSRQDLDVSGDLTGPLDASSPQAQAIAIRMDNTTGNGGILEDVMHTLNTGKNPAAVAFSMRGRDGENVIEPEDGEVAPALRCGGGGSDKSFVATVADAIVWAVRRLTPVECERLQGTADNFTRIPWRGKAEEDCPDGPRYKVVGNSKSVAVVEWIGDRIAAAWDE